MCDCGTDTGPMWRELRAARRELKRWRESDHSTIIEQCEKRVLQAKMALFRATGTYTSQEDL